MFFGASEGMAPAGRTPGLPGMGSLLLPPWTLTRYGPDGCEMTGYFTRFHVGGNMAVHGGVLPLLYRFATRVDITDVAIPVYLGGAPASATEPGCAAVRSSCSISRRIPGC